MRTAFNALSADDQQIYVAAKTLGKSLGVDDKPGAQLPGGYSPLDVKAITDALAKVDTSGGAMAKDQVAALNLLNGYAAAGGGPAGQAVTMNAAASPFAAHLAQTQTLVEKYLVAGEDPYPQMLDNLNKLSPEDQATYFSTKSKAADGTVLFGSLNSLKDNLTTRETMLTLYNQVTQAYGVSDLTQLKTVAQKNNPALQKLERLFRADQGRDAWTAQVRDFLGHTTMADLTPRTSPPRSRPARVRSGSRSPRPRSTPPRSSRRMTRWARRRSRRELRPEDFLRRAGPSRSARG